jgi:predicted small lipoprotein YifL
VTLFSLSRRLVPLSLVAGALALAGCGVKGPLDLPEGAATPSKQDSARYASSPNTRPPGYYESSSRDRKTQRQLGTPAKPDEPFVLDPLLN